ncbi:MAG TPA: carboxypeptidase regulatory-like domain-containing protein [Polyangiales bacterium]
MRSRAARIALLSLIPLGSLLVGYAAQPVSSGGTIQGTVRLTGPVPQLPPHQVTDPSQQQACTATVPNDELVVGAGGALANAVVWIEGITAGAPTQHAELTLDQRGCRYVPRVQAAAVGSQLTVISSDATLHNVHAMQSKRAAFNLAMPAKGMRVTRPLARPGIIEVKCDAGHTWMHAWIHVFDHPYFAVTGADGHFQLPSVPPGHYTVKVWHERYPVQTQQLDVAAGRSATWNVSFH